MRKLVSKDIFTAMKVINTIGAEEAIKALGGMLDDKKLSQEEFGTRVILYVMNLGEPKAMAAVYEFLSGPLEMTVPELEQMEAVEFLEKVAEFVKSVDVDRWKDFFHSLAGLMNAK